MPPEGPFLSEQNPRTAMWAVFDDDGTCAWLYVLDKAKAAVLGDCFVYNRIPTPAEETGRYVFDDQPPATASYASELAFIPDPKAHAISLAWSDDDVATVSIDGQTWAQLRADERRGYSLGLKAEGPFGRPLVSE